MPPHAEARTQAKVIPAPAGNLPCQIRLPGADIEVDRHEPFAIIPECVATLDPDNAVPDVLADLLASAATRLGDRTEISGDRPSECRLDAEHPRARENV